MNDLAHKEYCYLTTTGRVTGKPHEIEIWFGMRGGALYLLSGGGNKSDWVKNLAKNPNATVRIGKRTFNATGRLVQPAEEEASARTLLADKYNERESDGSLSEWARTALVVRLDISSTPSDSTINNKPA
ncbi:MAG: nitroreductase family deazaflavin-dependent oxidoreductase [Anaerolineales bacterium]|nr:nitroreductase family deazaflavin-dependent oxidoreductase [Anaerolineales bacterium]